MKIFSHLKISSITLGVAVAVRHMHGTLESFSLSKPSLR